MRILFISDVYFPRINGVSTSILTFRRELERLGHQVHLVAPDYAGTTHHEDWITRIPARRVLFDPEDRMMRMGEIMAHNAELQDFRPDIVHIQTPFVAHYAGVRLARRFGVPAVLSYHTYFEEYLYHYVPFLPKALLRYLVRHFSCAQCNDVDAVVVPSTAFRRVLHQYGVDNDVSIIPTGLDLERFTSGDGPAFRAKHGIAADRPLLLYVGRLVHEKNIDFLLRVVQEAKKSIPEVLFLMAGEGPADEHLRSAARRLDLADNVHFVGNIYDFAELQGCYCAADALIFASRTETQGLVLLEAMALGVPVVSTAMMGTRDILDARRGGLVCEERIEDFAANVVHLLKNHGLREELARDARAYVREWSAAAMAQRLAQLYHDSVESLGDNSDEEDLREARGEEG